MTAPNVCEHCSAALDAGEICDCQSAPGGAMEFMMGDSLSRLPKTIDFNFLELKAQLERQLETYRSIVVTEDAISAAKSDRAKLNKLRTALEDKRKEVKRECMAPYHDFEQKVKELVALIDRPINAIDGQLKAFDEQRKRQKRDEIFKIYEETVGDMRTVLPFERLWQDSWYNAASSMKKIRETIEIAQARVKADLITLENIGGEFAKPVQAKYLETLDLSTALAEHERLQQAAQALAERKALEQKRLAEQQAAPEPEPVQAPAPEPDENKLYLLRFECKLTRNQAAELSAWLRERGIEYRRV